MLETATWRPAVNWGSPLSILHPAHALSMHALSVDEHSPRLPMSAAARATREPGFLVEMAPSGKNSFYQRSVGLVDFQGGSFTFVTMAAASSCDIEGISERFLDFLAPSGESPL